ncbi:kinase-like domain-containing protein [Myxozyma melibiosi]|uniref:Kinase-like domain-containing protein n=1 Tax=Myxozyma melibiosi TaxID=54550 RepID=A0ABR1F4E2_9ASCO
MEFTKPMLQTRRSHNGQPAQPSIQQLSPQQQQQYYQLQLQQQQQPHSPQQQQQQQHYSQSHGQHLEPDLALPQHQMYLPQGPDPNLQGDSPTSRARDYRNTYSPRHNMSPTMHRFTPPAYPAMATSPYSQSPYTPAAPAADSMGRTQYGARTPVQYSPNNQYYSHLNMSPLHPQQQPQAQQQQSPYHLGVLPETTAAPSRQTLVNQFQALSVDSTGRRASTAVLMQQPTNQNPQLQQQFYTTPAPTFRKLRSRADLQPKKNIQPQYRRANPEGGFMSPLQALTVHIPSTYRICNPNFKYESSRNPRRVLTKPSKASKNNGYDNDDSDYILYVNDILGGGKDQQKYLILDILGQGTFGQVVKCQNLKTQEVVAVKVIKNKPAYFNQSMMEVSILEHLNTSVDKNDEHHLLRLRDKFIHREHLCLVFELLSSNLYDLIKQNQFRGLSTNLVRVFAQQLLDAMCVLKEAKLIHCDLKPENILLKNLESPIIKVIDFGSACHERQTVYTYIQSRFYRSPEVILGLPYSSSIDMWSLGCIVAELFLGLPLFPGSSEYNQLSRIIEMFGMPPTWMIEMGKQSPEFFEKVTDEYGRKSYRLKSMEKYSREHRTNEQPSKRYFAATKFPDIVNSYPMPKRNMKPAEIEREMQNRVAFIDFVQRLLNMNPVERWTPQQAKQHHFVAPQKAMPAASNQGATSSSMMQQQSSNDSYKSGGKPAENYSYQQPADLGSAVVPPAGSRLQGESSYHAPAQNPQYGTTSSNPYLPPQSAYSTANNGTGAVPMAQTTSARSNRPRAVTIGHMDPIPPKLQRVGNLIDPSNAIRAQPSPAYFPPPELEMGNSGSASGSDELDAAGNGGNAKSKRRGNGQHGDVIRNLEDGLSVSYWA